MSERDDIVTRLRTDDASDDLLISAASLLETDDDEIERLRAEVALWHQLWDNVALDVPDLRDDNKPLAVAASYELLKREVARLTAELKRVRRLPELEWAEACSRIMQVLASAARAGFPVRDTVAVAAMDAGKTYVDRINADRDALLARVEAWERAAQGEHPSPCTLGPLCPYCEIVRLQARVEAAERAAMERGQ